MTTQGLTEAVAEAAESESAELLLRLAEALESKQLAPHPTAGALQARLGVSSARVDRIQSLLGRAADLSELANLIRVAVATAERVRIEAPVVEVVATQPHAGKRIRTTGGVARDIVNAAAQRLIVVGFSVTADPALAGLAAKTVQAMGAAATRGVSVTAILHRDEANRAAMLRAWPASVAQPAFYTWPEQVDDRMAKMHAKVLVADDRDALVTSANLTYHGFVGNVEMGIRVAGKPASVVAKVFDSLIRDRQFVDWNP